MKARLCIGPVAGVLVTIAVACSSSTPTPPDQNVTEFCADWAKAYCQLSSFCQFDPNACVTNQTGVCTSFAGAAQQSGTRMYSQPNGKACIDALNAAFGNNPSSIPASAINALDVTCNKAFIGNQASDKPCTSNYDCVNGLVCAPLLGQSSNVCATVTPKNLGDICGDPGDTCQGDSYCAPVAGAAPQCIATPTTGSKCSTSIPCGPESRCVAGACEPRATIGQTCASSSDCAASAPYCDTYPPAACTTGLTFARGSIDCNGIAGTDTNTTPDASTTTVPDSSTADSAPAADSAPSGDGATTD